MTRRSWLIVRAVVVVMVAVVLPAVPMASATEQAPQPPERAQQDRSVRYSAPLLNPVVDPFRPPAHIGAPGNRGLEYGNSEYEIVGTAAAGFVTFAGSVGGRNSISIEHVDGVRTTYTSLYEIFVIEGHYVEQHSAIAVAADGFHFGARLNDHYLDPQILIDSSVSEARVRLLPATWPVP